MGNATKQIAVDLRHYGVLRTAEDVAIRAVNRVMVFKALKCIKIEEVSQEFLNCDEKYRGLFLEQDRLRDFAAHPEYELSLSFLDRAFEKGDQCYGFLDGNVLAAYGWYSSRPTETGWLGLEVRFGPEYVYMYKGFTHARHRGKRLHAIGMTRALAAYLARGYKGILSYVEWNNFGSLRSCYRMGYHTFGNIYAAGVSEKHLMYCDSGCRAIGFRLAPADAGAGSS